MTALNEEGMNGVVMTWYPDFTAYPAEYYSCIAEKRMPHKRMGTLFNFKFDLTSVYLQAFKSLQPCRRLR